jgi:hypothetical protein
MAAASAVMVPAKRRERYSGRGDRKAESHDAIPQLKYLGVSATQSSRWQK